MVKLDKFNSAIKIPPYLFSIFCTTEQRDVASRKQIPLKLAFALTVHKLQSKPKDLLSIGLSIVKT